MSAPRLVATGSQTVGPFFHFGPGAVVRGSLVTPDTAGQRIRLHLRLLDGAAEPVPDALIEIWQADVNGRYPDTPRGPHPPEGFHGFGRLPTDSGGVVTFETIRPGAIGAADAAHINVCLFMRGLLRHLYTRVYFAGDPALSTDAVLAMVPAERRSTLIAAPDAAGRIWTLDLHLQGARETVFFDL